VSERDDLTNIDNIRSQILSAQRLGSAKAKYDFLGFGTPNLGFGARTLFAGF
jgi:hypothetical protein